MTYFVCFQCGAPATRLLLQRDPITAACETHKPAPSPMLSPFRAAQLRDAVAELRANHRCARDYDPCAVCWLLRKIQDIAAEEEPTGDGHGD